MYDREIDTATIDSYGSVRWGTTDDIPATGGDPWTGFVQRFDRAKETQPWLEDAEVFSVFTAAWLEGREPEKWELESTDWWQEHNEAQQEWLWLAARNPAEAEQYKDENYIKTYNAFVDLGMEEVSDEMVRYMADRFSVGDWNSTQLTEQIDALFNPDSAVAIDEGLQSFITTNKIDLGTPALGTTDVRAMWSKWLGPAYQPTDAQVVEWSAKLRKGGDGAEDQLTEYLRGQRMSLFPEYENSDLTYDDIASPWRSYVTNTWGQQADETSPMFAEILKANDAATAGQILRREGLKENVGAVKQDALTGLMGQTSTVRSAV